MASAIEALRESGFAEATLWTSKDNHRPRRIYEVARWKLDGTMRDKPWRGATWRELRYRFNLLPAERSLTRPHSDLALRGMTS